MRQTANKSGYARTLVKLFAAASIVLGAVGVSQTAFAGIANTKHNLGINGSANNGGANNYVTVGTAEICVFCHTPHGSNTSVKAPIWNKALPGTNYTTYASNNSTTINGQILAVGSVSLACLSCHDGTQAMDNMINAPGSGWGVGGGAGASQGYTWSGANQTGGILKSTVVTNLGADLTNDHPIGIEYCGGTTSAGTYAGGSATTPTCVNKDFNTATKGSANGTTVWWVDTSATSFVSNGSTSTVGGTSGVREKTDIILYTRNEAGNGNTDKPYVECASCHDPHVESKGVSGAPQVAFLRVSQAGSGVCLSCHTK